MQIEIVALEDDVTNLSNFFTNSSNELTNSNSWVDANGVVDGATPFELVVSFDKLIIWSGYEQSVKKN